MQLNRARILLTGATGGLGEALASHLSAAGAALLLTGRNEDKLAAIPLVAGAECVRLQADLATTEGIAAAAAAARRFNANMLINNAGVGGFGLLESQDWTEVEQILATNLAVPIRLTHALLPWLKAQPEATVVNIGSTFGSIPFAGFAAYSSAKAGLRGFSQALRRELADSSVRVIHIAPRAIDTSLNSAAGQPPECGARKHQRFAGRGGGADRRKAAERRRRKPPRLSGAPCSPGSTEYRRR
jgi:short-subunit dehydrogenase